MEQAAARRNRRVAVKIAATYALLAGLWILLSDEAVALLVPEGRVRVYAQTTKGWLFVLVTAAILFVTLRRYLGRIAVGEDALRGSERRLERIVATIPSAVVIVDRGGVVTSANHAAEALLRMPARSIVGQPFQGPGRLLESLSGAPLDAAESPLALVLAEGEPVYDVRYAIVHPDGARTIVSTNASPLLDEAGDPVAVVTASLDVTASYSAEQKLMHVNRLYSTLSRTNQAILRIREEDELYLEACRIAVEYGRFRMAWVGRVDSVTGDIRPVAHAGEDRGYLEGLHISARDDDTGRGPSSTAARLGRAVISNDIEHDPHMRMNAERALERGYRSSAAVPLHTESGSVFAVLSVYAAQTGFFDAEETGLLEDLAADIAFGVKYIRRETGDGPL